MNPKDIQIPKRAQSIIKRFEDAAIYNSWKGGGDPGNIPAIEAEYKEAKETLIAFIEELYDRIDRSEETVMELGDEIRMLERDKDNGRRNVDKSDIQIDDNARASDGFLITCCRCGAIADGHAAISWKDAGAECSCSHCGQVVAYY